MNQSPSDDSLRLEVDKGQGSGIGTTGEDEDVADHDSTSLLGFERPNFSQSWSFEGLLVDVEASTPTF